MAQTQQRNLNTIISKFYGGMSNDDYVWNADAGWNPMCFYDGCNVEIRKNAKFIQLSSNYPSTTDFGSYATYWDAISMIQTWTNDMAVFYQKKKVFSNLASVVHTTSDNIVNSFVYGWYWYIIKSNWKLDRWLIQNGTVSEDCGITTSTVTTDYANLWFNLINTTCPILFVDWFFYLWDSNKVYKFDPASAFSLSSTLTLDVWFTVKALTKIWDRVNAYATDDSKWMQWLWNGQNLATWWNATNIVWYDKPILNVANINNVDYVITGDSNKRAFYRADWYQATLINQSKWYRSTTVNEKFFFNPDFTNWIETIGNVIYFAGNGQIYAWGTYFPWFPESTTRQITFQSANRPTVIQSDTVWANLYYFYQNSSGKNIRSRQYIPDGVWHSLDPGTIILNPIISDLYSNEDSSLKIRIGYDLPSTSQLVNVYAKSNYSWGFENFYSDTLSTFPVIWDTYTYWWVTYTVYALTTKTANAQGIVHCTRTVNSVDIHEIYDRTSGTCTKATWTWPATFTFYRMTHGMELIGQCTNTETHKELFDINDPNFQVTFMLDLVTWDVTKTPRVWDIVYAYSNIENDI